MITVTGASGFVGSVTVHALAAAGHDVRAWGSGEHRDTAGRRRGELTDESTMDAIDGSSVVVHAACTLADDRDTIQRVDLAGAAALLRRCAGAHVVFISSIDVHRSSAVPITEATDPDPASGYGWGKAAVEQLVLRAAASGAVAGATVLRVPFVFGVHPRFAVGPWATWIRTVRAGRSMRVGPPAAFEPGAGSSWIAADDLGRCVEAAVRTRAGGIVDVASGYVDWIDLVTVIDGSSSPGSSSPGSSTPGRSTGSERSPESERSPGRTEIVDAASAVFVLPAGRRELAARRQRDELGIDRAQTISDVVDAIAASPARTPSASPTNVRT